MHRERLQILRRRNIDVCERAAQKANLQIAVHAACGSENGAGRQSRDIVTISKIRIVRDGQDDFIRSRFQYAVGNRELERNGEAGAECDKLPVDPYMHLVAHALEVQDCGPCPTELDMPSVEEATVNVRQRYVARPATDWEILPFVPRIDAELVRHASFAERLAHVLPVSGNRIRHYHASEHRRLDRLECIRDVRHLPVAVQGDGVVSDVFECGKEVPCRKQCRE